MYQSEISQLFLSLSVNTAESPSASENAGTTLLRQKVELLSFKLEALDSIISFFSWISGGMLAIAALILAAAAYFIIRENRHVKKMNEGAKQSLDLLINTAQKDVSNEITSIRTLVKNEGERFRRAAALILELNNTSPRKDVITPFVDFLSQCPHIHERGMFNDIKKLNLSPEINSRCDEALERIREELNVSKSTN